MRTALKRSHHTIVIGGGISGLACAHALGRGADVCLLEGSDRVGGLVRTAHVTEPIELRYEDGPEALTTSESLRALASELEVPLAEPGATQRFLVRRGQLVAVPMSPSKLLGSDLLSFRGKLRLLSEPWRTSGPELDGSIADFIRQRMGPEVLAALVDPLVSGIHAGDPEELSARACFPRLVRMVEDHGSLFAGMRAGRRSGAGPRPGITKPRGGMESLAKALERRLGERVRLGVKVEQLQGRGERWVLDTSAGPIEADRVVLALPLRAARRLLESAAPAAARALAGMRCESLASLIAAYRREDVAHELDGFGYLVPSSEGRQHLGTLFSSSIDPDACSPDVVLLRILIGGSRHAEIVERSDEALATLRRDEVHPLLGIKSEPLWSQVVRYRDVLPRFGLDHPRNLARLESALPPGLKLLGNYTHGIGLAALVDHARSTASSLQSEAKP